MHVIGTRAALGLGLAATVVGGITVAAMRHQHAHDVALDGFVPTDEPMNDQVANMPADVHRTQATYHVLDSAIGLSALVSHRTRARNKST